jgi:hypothetical protein
MSMKSISNEPISVSQRLAEQQFHWEATHKDGSKYTQILPEEIIQHTLSFLSPGVLLIVACVNSFFQQHANNEILWKTLIPPDERKSMPLDQSFKAFYFSCSNKKWNELVKNKLEEKLKFPENFLEDISYTSEEAYPLIMSQLKNVALHGRNEQIINYFFTEIYSEDAWINIPANDFNAIDIVVSDKKNEKLREKLEKLINLGMNPKEGSVTHAIALLNKDAVEILLRHIPITGKFFLKLLETLEKSKMQVESGEKNEIFTLICKKTKEKLPSDWQQNKDAILQRAQKFDEERGQLKEILDTLNQPPVSSQQETDAPKSTLVESAKRLARQFWQSLPSIVEDELKKSKPFEDAIQKEKRKKFIKFQLEIEYVQLMIKAGLFSEQEVLECALKKSDSAKTEMVDVDLEYSEED